jgi:hypothetical protein
LVAVCYKMPFIKRLSPISAEFCATPVQSIIPIHFRAIQKTALIFLKKNASRPRDQLKG